MLSKRSVTFLTTSPVVMYTCLHQAPVFNSAGGKRAAEGERERERDGRREGGKEGRTATGERSSKRELSNHPCVGQQDTHPFFVSTAGWSPSAVATRASTRSAVMVVILGSSKSEGRARKRRPPAMSRVCFALLDRQHFTGQGTYFLNPPPPNMSSRGYAFARLCSLCDAAGLVGCPPACELAATS